MPPCDHAVSSRKTKDSRSFCLLPGRLYTVAGGVANVVMACCKRHARMLKRRGRSVIELTPLEVNALKQPKEPESSLLKQHYESSIPADSFTCSGDLFSD
jgi:hypothetical protein